MEINDLTEFEIPNQTQAPTGPLKIQDYSGIDPFSQKAAAAENAIVSTKQSAVHVAKPSGLPKGYLSYSQIDLFLRCPFAYYQRYFSKMQVDSDKVAAEFGKLIHKVLEETYNWVKSSKYRGKFPLETAYDFLKKFWAHPEHGMAGARPEFWLDARDILRKYAQENAMVDCADVLAVELGDLWTDEEDPKPIPNANIGGVPFVAKLDLVLRMDEKRIRIRDYKTDRMLRYKEDLDRDLQLGIYDIVAREAFPWAEEVELELYMLRHGVSQLSDTRDPEKRGDITEFVREVAHQIATEQKWEPRLNEFCHWCDYKGACSKYSDALEGGTTEKAILARDLVQIGENKAAFASMFDLRDEYNNRRGVLDRRKKSFDKALTKFMDHVPGSEIVIGDREYYVLAQRRTEYEDRLAVVELMSKRLFAPEGFVDALIAKVQKTAIDKALESLGKKGQTIGEVFGFEGEGAERRIDPAYVEMLRIELESIATVSYSTRLVSRKAKIPKDKRAKREREAIAIPKVTDSAIDKAARRIVTSYEMKGDRKSARTSPELEPAPASVERVPVNSSHLQSIGYDPASQILEIEFKDRGVYQFFAVPDAMHKNLMAAPSKGTFFSENIRKVYKYAKTKKVGHERPAEVPAQKVDPIWNEATSTGVKPVGDVTFRGSPDDYIDPDVALAMWRKANGGPLAAKRKGVLGPSEVTRIDTAPVRDTDPAPASEPISVSVAPAVAPEPALDPLQVSTVPPESAEAPAPAQTEAFKALPSWVTGPTSPPPAPLPKPEAKRAESKPAPKVRPRPAKRQADPPPAEWPPKNKRKRKPMSEETKAKIRAAVRDRWARKRSES